MILRPFLYDVKRTITSKTVLILVGIVLLISLAIIPLTSIGNTGFQANPFQAVLYYHEPGAYHYLAYFSNQYGDPINGVTLTVAFQAPQNYTKTVITNSTGLAFVTLNVPDASYSVSIKEETGGSVAQFTLPPTNSLSSTPGAIQPLSGQIISTITDKANASKRNIQVFYASDYGRIPSGYTVYYKIQLSYSTPYYNLNQTDMTRLGTLSSYHQTFDPSIPGGLNESARIVLKLFYPNGTELKSAAQSFSTFELRQPRQPIMETNIAAFFFSSIFGLVIPLMAIIGSYSSYGKDRLTGVLESVLARPVSRRGLAMSRFFSTLLAFGLAAAAAVGIVDLLLNNIGGNFLDQSYVLAVIGGLIVEAAAFTGLIFLLSHVLKSTGALLGISIVLFIVLDFFWSLIVFLLTLLLGGTSGSAVALQATLFSYYANPAQFLNLVNVYVFANFSGTPIQASMYGVSLLSLVVAGVMWSVLPFLAFLYLATKRD